jgi:PAS domain S-box-containing protein
MENEESGRGQFQLIRKFIGEMTEIFQRLAELQASEAKNRKATEAYQASAQKYREVIENLPQRVFVKDKNLVYVLGNETYARDLKIKPDEIAGKTDRDFFPEELAAKYRADEQRILNSGKAEEFEDRYIVSGQELNVRSYKIPLRDERGTPKGILAILGDISKEKRAEQEREKSVATLKGLASERAVQIETLNDRLEKEIAQHKRMEEEFQGVRQSLEKQLSDLKTSLDKANGELEREVNERKRTATALQQTTRQLQSLMVALNDLVSGDQK